MILNVSVLLGAPSGFSYNACYPVPQASLALRGGWVEYNHQVSTCTDLWQTNCKAEIPFVQRSLFSRNAVLISKSFDICKVSQRR